MIIGLTGSSGSGKSTVARVFENAGYLIVDCDEISRNIDNDPYYKNAVRESFGDVVFDGQGRIDRRALGNVVFSDAKKLELLTGISHPIIKSEVFRRIDRAEKAVIDAPLLFESGLDKECDITIGVISKGDIRANRVAARDNLDIKDAMIRTSMQKNDDFYRENCVYIIENNGSIDELEKKVSDVLSGLEN